jgi:hypothetical protein
MDKDRCKIRVNDKCYQLGGAKMTIFNDKIAKNRMDKAKKEFDNLRKPTKHFTKLDLVNSFRKQ